MFCLEWHHSTFSKWVVRKKRWYRENDTTIVESFPSWTNIKRIMGKKWANDIAGQCGRGRRWRRKNNPSERISSTISSTSSPSLSPPQLQSPLPATVITNRLTIGSAQIPVQELLEAFLWEFFQRMRAVQPENHWTSYSHGSSFKTKQCEDLKNVMETSEFFQISIFQLHVGDIKDNWWIVWQALPQPIR